MTTLIEFPVQDVEKRASALFRHRSSLEHRRLAIVLVFDYINKNPKTTEGNLKHNLKKLYNLGDESIDGAIGALVAEQCFGCVKSWYYPNSKNVTRFTAIEKQSTIEDWVTNALSWRPEWKGFVNEAVC